MRFAMRPRRPCSGRHFVRVCRDGQRSSQEFRLHPTSCVALPFSPASPRLYTSAETSHVKDDARGAMQHLVIMSGSDDDKDDGDASVIVDTRPKTKRPPLYKVLLLNDDYTPMEFVVAVLERFFGMSHAQAFEIMLTVHKKGVAVVGVFSHEIAETKVAQVMDFARRHQHPLQCTMEKE
jgi:ATP-dependent Clp protease adaptor protein ClpS